MSLNHAERVATRAELAANLDTSGLTVAHVSEELGLSERQVRSVMSLTLADPARVWLVRDYLDLVIRENGDTPTPYTKLTEDSRAAAQAWFGLADVRDVVGR